MTTRGDFVARERAALADEFAERGPDQPTLCEGWQTRDLLQHLVVRDAGPLRGGRAAKARVQAEDWPDLIRDFREGPPAGSPFRLPVLGTAANLEEFFVHHEDVRRGADGWSRRELPPEIEDAIWRRLRSVIGKLAVRRAGVGVQLHRTDDAPENNGTAYDGAAASDDAHPGDGSVPPGAGGGPADAHGTGSGRSVIPEDHRLAEGAHVTLRATRPGVVVSGSPSELLIFLFGRQRAADVTLHGPADAQDRLARARLGF